MRDDNNSNNCNLFRKGRSHHGHGTKSEKVDECERTECHVLSDSESEIPTRAFVFGPFSTASTSSADTTIADSTAAGVNGAMVERHRATRNTAQFAERVAVHGQGHAAGVAELLGVIDAQLLGSATTASLDRDVVVDRKSAIDRRNLARGTGRGFVGQRRRYISVGGQQVSSYVLVIVRTSVLLAHTHPRSYDVVVRFQTTW